MSFILPLLPGEAATKAAERYFDKEIVRMDKAKRKAIIDRQLEDEQDRH